MNTLYLLVNLCSVAVPFLFSFHPRLRFYKQFYAAIPAILITAFVFVGWDFLYTDWGVWGFNNRYITGYHLFNLPAEEVLFFICIPYSCLFTYHCLTLFYRFQWKPSNERLAVILIVAALLMIGMLYADRAYTVATCISTAMLLFLFYFVFRVKWMGKLLSIYPVLLIPFFIVNGILTGTGLDEPVVWYNNAENLGLRMHTIPVEDAVYGFELILLNLGLYHAFSRNS